MCKTPCERSDFAEAADLHGWRAMFEDGKNSIGALQSLALSNTAVETLFHTGETELVSKYVCEMYDESTNVNKKSPPTSVLDVGSFCCFR